MIFHTKDLMAIKKSISGTLLVLFLGLEDYHLKRIPPKYP